MKEDWKLKSMKLKLSTLKDEIEQLKSTASSLREALENQRLDYEALIQQQDKSNIDDKIHLQKTIETIRSKLEKANA